MYSSCFDQIFPIFMPNLWRTLEANEFPWIKAVNKDEHETNSKIIIFGILDAMPMRFHLQYVINIIRVRLNGFCVVFYTIIPQNSIQKRIHIYILNKQLGDTILRGVLHSNKCKIFAFRSQLHVHWTNIEVTFHLQMEEFFWTQFCVKILSNQGAYELRRIIFPELNTYWLFSNSNNCFFILVN